MSEHTYLIPLFKYEIADAFRMERTEFWRKTGDLKILKGKVVPSDILKICKKLNRDVKILENYIQESNICKHKN